MNKEKIAIGDMQCWIFRKAQTKWNLTPAQCADVFQKYDLLGFIDECYDLLKTSSYQRTLEDVEDILRGKGISFE